MGDSPSLLYMMDGNPNHPERESWGGSFTPFNHSPRVVYDRATTIVDTVAFCSVVEFHLSGPETTVAADSACFWMETMYKNNVQKWPGFYAGKGRYVIKYVPKQAEVLSYKFSSNIPGFPQQEGNLVVTNSWPGKVRRTDYTLGDHWFTDRGDPELYDGKIQGGKTILKWRKQVLMDWAKRWEWIK